MVLFSAMKPANGRSKKVSAGSFLALGVFSAFIAVRADARDDRLRFPILDAMSTAEAKAKLPGTVRFYFGKQPHPAPIRQLGEYTANKKTNFLNKSDKDGCEWV